MVDIEEESKVSRLAKLGTLGGKIQVNQNLKGLYGGGGGNMTKERLFGAYGPLHPGMPHHKGEMAVASLESDTSQDLVKELVDKGLTRDEARQTITDLLKAGFLVEEYDPDLKSKVLVFRR